MEKVDIDKIISKLLEPKEFIDVTTIVLTEEEVLFIWSEIVKVLEEDPDCNKFIEY